MSRLLARLDDLLAETTAPSTLDIDLRAFVEDKLFAHAGRAESARERSRERSAALRDRVRQAVGALPLDHPLPKLVFIVGKRLKPKVSPQVIRHELPD